MGLRLRPSLRTRRLIRAQDMHGSAATGTRPVPAMRGALVIGPGRLTRGRIG